MDWQKQLYPGLWCMLFIIAGFQILIIKLISGSNDKFLIGMYYACAIAALVALCFLVINCVKCITEKQSGN